MIKLSVFTVTAVVFFLLGIYSNAHLMGDYYESGIEFIISKNSTSIPMPGLTTLVIIMNILLALRLYIHAWIIDENEKYQQALKKVSLVKKCGEWILRLLWVAGISWLPSAYGKFPVTVLGAKIHIHYYLLAILIFLLFWDLLMNSTILSYTSQSKKDLIENWLKLDVIMVVIIFSSCLFLEVSLKNEIFNWLGASIPLGYFLVCIISFYQLILWIPSIFSRSNIAFSQNNK